MISDGILVMKNGEYKVYVSIQDGSEHVGDYKEKEVAVKAYKDAQRAYNHNENKQPSFYEVVQKVTEVVRKIK